MKPWWDIGDKSDQPDWEDVRRMTMAYPDADPILYIAKERQHFFAPTLQLFLSYLALGCLSIVSLSIIAENRVLPFLLTRYPDNDAFTNADANIVLDLSSNLTAFLALIAAAVSIYFTHRQLQAKVKAESRQAWIDKLRARIAKTIALADAIHERPSKTEAKKLTIEFSDSRLEMELMLNPSEKDHRLLMYLSLKLAFYNDGHGEFEKVHDVKNLRASVQKCPRYDESKWEPIMGPIPREANNDKYSDLIGYTLRLAHVVLKREWERVKVAR